MYYIGICVDIFASNLLLSVYTYMYSPTPIYRQIRECAHHFCSVTSLTNCRHDCMRIRLLIMASNNVVFVLKHNSREIALYIV